MSSHQRRLAARRRAWGRGPATLRYIPAPATRAVDRANLPATAAEAVLGLVRADGSRVVLVPGGVPADAEATATPKGSGRRFSPRLRPEGAHLRLYFGEGLRPLPARELRQA